MPSTEQFFKTAAGQSPFTVAERISDYEEEPALEAMEPTALILQARFMQTRADYARPAASTPLAYRSQIAYFINDSGFRDEGAGICTWVRTWATVPASWSDPEDYPYLYPSFSGGGSFGTTYAVSAITVSGGNYIVSHASSSGIAAADSVFFNLLFTRGGAAYNQSFTAVAVNTTNTSQTTITGGLLGTGAFSAVSGFIAKSIANRAAQRSEVVGSIILRDYALSSVAALDTDLPINQIFSPVDSTGAQVTALTATTQPTAAAYAALVTSGSRIVIECTRRRYLGNIFCRATRTIPAI